MDIYITQKGLELVKEPHLVVNEGYDIVHRGFRQSPYQDNPAIADLFSLGWLSVIHLLSLDTSELESTTVDHTSCPT
jgi:hypothetical protein